MNLNATTILCSDPNNTACAMRPRAPRVSDAVEGAGRPLNVGGRFVGYVGCWSGNGRTMHVLSRCAVAS